jgi:hypothetical protein
MSRDHKIDRKQFLTWSLATAGGVMIGCTTSESGTPDGGGGSTGASGSSGATGGSGGATAGTTGSTGGNGGATAGTTGSTGGSGGAIAGSGGGGSGGTTGATASCSTKLKVTITSNHGHVLTILAADITAAVTKSYQTKDPDPAMNSMHFHWVQLTATDFADLAAGKTVRKGSCNEGHEHAYIINCLGVTSTEMPSVAAAICGDHPGCGDMATTTCPSLPAP